jgi:polyhydroxyalkanoate synthase
LLDYIVERLEPALAAARQIAGAPIGVVGYCMGGLLSLALALRRQPQIACLALLATPWNFHAESIQSLRLARATDSLVRLSSRGAKVPIEAIRTLFYVLDPFSAVRKFIRFANLDPDSSEARSFVALEDWINDGVPLSIRVSRSCACSWYMDNEPGGGLWRLAGQLVRPQALCRPTLVVRPRSRPDSSSRLGRTACGSFRRRDTPAAAARPRRNDGSHTRTRCVVDTHRKLVARPVEQSLSGRRLAGLPATSPVHSRPPRHYSSEEIF